MSDIDPVIVRRLLLQAGYVVVSRHDGWWECLASLGAERWLGRGPTEEAALADVLRTMAPSKLAWDALVRHANAAETPQVAALDTAGVEGSEAPVADRPQVAGPAPEVAATAAAAAGPDASHADDEAPAPEFAAAPDGAPAAEEATAPESADAAAPTPVAAQAEVQATPQPAAPPEPAAAPPEPDAAATAGPLPPPGPDPADILEEVGLLRARIGDARADVAAMADDLQRLHILTWICRARSLQEQAPSELIVERAVGEVARRLGELTRRWWPGSVKALQVRATPLDAGAEMGLPDGGRLHDWREAADRAEGVLETHLDGLSAAGLDEDGWADTGALRPPPNKPAMLLKELHGAIERGLGPVAEPPPRSERERLRRAGPEELERLLSWARRLRWLRTIVDDTELWSALMGRVRWAAANVARDRAAPIREALDPRFCPRQPWASVLGQDPTAKRQRRRRSEVLRGLPRSADDAESEALASWLGEAFDLGTELPNPRIAGLLHPIRDQVLAFEADQLAENSRRTRKRLTDLKRRLEAMSSAEAEQIQRAAAREIESAAPAPEPEPEAESTLSPDPMAGMTEQVRSRTRGKRALFVSNREDPALKARLEALLELDVAWTVIDPRRVQAKCEAIGRGSYDFVLSATGFQSHTVDAALYRASRQAGVRYVRVNRGRPQACVRSLARELGLQAA